MHRTTHPPSRSPRRRLAALATAALVALGTAATPAAAEIPATTSLWGYSGLVLVPTAHVHGFRDYSVGAHLLTKATDVRLAPYATAGIFEGLEFGILYGVPIANFSGLTGHAKYQLVKPTKDRPTSVAVGLSLLGVNTSDRWVDGNNVYLVLSQDFNATFGNATYTLFSGHFGFSGNLSLGARMMGGLELPLADKGSLVADYMGPMGAVGGFFNLGATYRLTKEVQLRAFTMGVPGMEWTTRDYALGVSYAGNLLGNSAEVVNQPGAQPTSKPTPRPTAVPTPTPTPRPQATPGGLPSLPPVPSARPLPVPSPIPTAPAELVEPSPPVVPSPPGLPTPAPTAAVPTPATGLRGALLDDKGRPLSGWSVGVKAIDRWVTTDDKGRYALALPMGPHEVTVQDPQGRAQLSKSVRIVSAQGMELPLVVAIPVGELKGMVIDKQTRQGVGDASVRLFRQGETYNLSSRDNGAFYLGDLPVGDYRVVVTRSRYQPFEGTMAIAARQEKSLVVSLAPNPGSLAGKVVSLKGQGQPGIVVTIPSLKQTVTTDRLGAYQFRELPPGEHEVVFTQGDRRVATTLVRVRSDETSTENVTMRPAAVVPSKGGTISGQITDAVSKRPVSGVKIVVESGDLTVLTITASDGKFNVTDLPGGSYRVTATRAGYKSRTVTARVSAQQGAVVNMGLTLGR